MPLYVKKPIVVEAERFTNENKDRCYNFATRNCAADWINDQPILKIQTLEGVMTASLGDWIIRGINGEFYPCKPDIFLKTYDPVEKDKE